MNRYGIRPYLMLGLLLFAGAAQAVDPMKVRLNGKEKGWKGNIELGYVKTSGNSDTTSGIMKLAITGVFTDWVHDFTSRGYQATDSGNTTASNLTAQWRSNYVLRRQIDYLFGLVRYDTELVAA